MINNVVLMGRLTAEPELKTTQSGISYCRFSIAVERPYSAKNEEKTTDFINCVAWRSTAEFIEKYFVKGQMIALTGSLRTGSYTNKYGAKVNTVDINVDSVSFTGDKRESGTSAAYTHDVPRQRAVPVVDSRPEFGADSGSRAPRPSSSMSPKSGVSIDVAAEMNDDDLPF